jgi:hypothetical protein
VSGQAGGAGRKGGGRGVCVCVCGVPLPPGSWGQTVLQGASPLSAALLCPAVLEGSLLGSAGGCECVDVNVWLCVCATFYTYNRFIHAPCRNARTSSSLQPANVSSFVV